MVVVHTAAEPGVARRTSSSVADDGAFLDVDSWPARTFIITTSSAIVDNYFDATAKAIVGVVAVCDGQPGHHDFYGCELDASKPVIKVI